MKTPTFIRSMTTAAMASSTPWQHMTTHKTLRLHSGPSRSPWSWWSLWWLGLCWVVLSLVGCGGGGGSGETSTPTTSGSAAVCDASTPMTTLQAVPAALSDTSGSSSSGSGGAATTLTVHYHRNANDYSGWQLHSWGAAKDPGWNNGHNASGTDAFGAIYSVPLTATTGTVGYLFHNGDNKDHGGQDQSHTLTAGANEIWRLEGDATTYTSNPLSTTAPDIRWVRVHYKRYDGRYDQWGLHLWEGSGLDVPTLAAVLPTGLSTGQWSSPIPLSALPGYTVGNGEVVFDLPVLNPQADASRKTLEFIIHGTAANPNGGLDNKDGRSDNIRVSYAALTVQAQVGAIWLVQSDAAVYTAAPDLRRVSSTDARAYWLTRQLIQWPQVDTTGVFKLYHSATGQLRLGKGQAVQGADGALTLSANRLPVPSSAAQRFQFVGAGVVLAVADADMAQLPALLQRQLVLVQENEAGLVQNASTAQLPGALDDLYAPAVAATDLGVTPGSGQTQFALWAPTAQKVTLCSYPTATSSASLAVAMTLEPTTGIWRHSHAADLSGTYYRYAVETFVRGVGLVRNLVTDPYAISLSSNSERTYVGRLDSAALKPTGWDQHSRPAALANPVDMSIYELHVRDFSANDSSVSSAHRGRFMAFTETQANGMQHLRNLAQAGLTDVHLLPVFDFATVPEVGCQTPSISGGPTSSTQQAAVGEVKDSDCFNWGYDPLHYSTPEGSYATDASDGAVRVREMRQMVMALHGIGLRVGMDVVYNHTSAAGQNAKAVLDRIVPGYYQRLSATGDLETSTCCANTATENAMMAKLMIDSVVQWATQYGIDSFRFDLMGHQPRSVMESLKTRVASATGRDIAFLGEGWNFGEVANGARFEQASQLSLNGSGIGTFSDRARDALRGGSPFDSGDSLVKNQGLLNGLYYDPNSSTSTASRANLLWASDMARVGLAGSIRTYSLTTAQDQTKTLAQLDYNGQPAGYVSQPQEVVNYIENHDNQTLFDINAYKLPVSTSREDRARVQMLGVAINLFSQGIPYFHAGVDVLRSKSMDRNSYNSGDWFNRLDWRYQDNYFATGLPPEGDNGSNWSVMTPLLGNSLIKPTATEIALARDMFRDLLRIRASTTLLRLRTAQDIQTRLSFANTGSAQEPTLLVGQIDGNGYAGANFRELVYLVNVDKAAHSLDVPSAMGKAFELHPVHTAAGAADRRAATQASFDRATGRFTVPARTAVVFVVNG